MGKTDECVQKLFYMCCQAFVAFICAGLLDYGSCKCI